jgi:hypothetical protein
MKAYAHKQNQPQQQVSSDISRSRARSLAATPMVDSIMHLQSTIGNQAVQRLLHSNAENLDVGSDTSATARFAHDFSRIPVHSKAPGKLQAKLRVNTPGDIYEQEADRVAEQVTSMPEPQLQRSCACGGGCPGCQNEQAASERLLMKSVQVNNTAGIEAPYIVNDVLRSSGQPLDPSTRAFMESRFGHDFSRVRVHTEKASAESASAIGALAYTAGHHIVFGQGQYEPTTKAAQRLLAHELTHVAQQTTGSSTLVQRQTDISEKDKSKKGGPFVVKEGNIEKRGLSFEFEYRSTIDQEKAGRVAVRIELAYTRKSSSKYADPSKLDWFQTLQTNYMTSDNEVPPKETEIMEYTDGCSSTTRQDACLISPRGRSTFTDQPYRHSLTDRDVYWKAETSVVGASDNGLEILGTVEWGFQMDKKGHPKYIQLRQVATPSSYHLRKFQELMDKEE